MKLKTEYWPWLITAILGSFIALMVTLVFIATRVPLNLVDENYYDKAVIFQDNMDQLHNASALSEKPDMQVQKNQMTLVFPDSLNDEIEGQINFYSPLTKKEDQSIKIDLQDRKQVVDLTKFRKGRWVIKLSWKMADKSYIIKQNIVLE